MPKNTYQYYYFLTKKLNYYFNSIKHFSFFTITKNHSFYLTKVCVAFSFMAAFFFRISGNAQEIDFGSYNSSYSVTVSELNPGEDLSFGTILQNEGIKNIDLANAKIITIEGIKYLDVMVDITADDALLLNGDINCSGNASCSIPFTLEAAYTNRGSNNINQAIIMPVIANTATAQFPVQYRGNSPPGPPPTPAHQGYNPALYNSTAYLYVYGYLNIGNINSGSYLANITITVTYD